MSTTNSISAAAASFLQSLTAIGLGILNSVLAVLQAVFSLGANLVGSVLQLGQALIELASSLFQGVIGFALGNFFAIALVGGLYYWYTTRQGGRSVAKRS